MFNNKKIDKIDKIKAIRKINQLIEIYGDNKYRSKPHAEIKNLVYDILSLYYYNVNIYIEQYSKFGFGFEISYILYYKNKDCFTFSERALPDDYNRHNMNTLILSNCNEIRFKKYQKNKELKNLSQIEY